MRALCKRNTKQRTTKTTPPSIDIITPLHFGHTIFWRGFIEGKVLHREIIEDKKVQILGIPVVYQIVPG